MAVHIPKVKLIAKYYSVFCFIALICISCKFPLELSIIFVRNIFTGINSDGLRRLQIHGIQKVIFNTAITLATQYVDIKRIYTVPAQSAILLHP
jgi:hypothetical protein